MFGLFTSFSLPDIASAASEADLEEGTPLPAPAQRAPGRAHPGAAGGLWYMTLRCAPDSPLRLQNACLPTCLYGLCFYDLSSLYAHPVQRRLRLGTPFSCAQTGPAMCLCGEEGKWGWGRTQNGRSWHALAAVWILLFVHKSPSVPSCCVFPCLLSQLRPATWPAPRRGGLVISPPPEILGQRCQG